MSNTILLTPGQTGCIVRDDITSTGTTFTSAITFEYENGEVSYSVGNGHGYYVNLSFEIYGIDLG